LQADNPRLRAGLVLAVQPRRWRRGSGVPSLSLGLACARPSCPPSGPPG